MWGQAEKKTTSQQKAAWQTLGDLQILEALEKFRPENQQTKQFSLAKSLEKDMMDPEHRVSVNFSNRYNSESIELIGRFTQYQLRFENINREEVMNSNNELQLLRDFSKAIRIL